MVDVPGHEDFVRTMVAGASGVDLALLVVAADEGIMPQTLEHLSVLEHLGVRAGIPVLAKADLVDRDWLELVAAELGERLARSPVAFEPPVPVSAKTGEGLDHLRQRIAEYARALVPAQGGDLFRLPVDRAFSVAGVGTVVTGTTWSGRIKVGDEVVLLPLGRRGRVRSIEMHGRAVDRSEPRRRTAVGVAGISREDVTRGGMLVAAADPWMATRALDVEVALDPSAPRPLVPRSRIRLHHGTAEIIGRVFPRTPPVEPGSRGVARIALEADVVARAGDRFVIRSFSPVATIGGGVVLDPIPPPRRARWPGTMASAEPGARLEALVERRAAGVRDERLPLLTGLPPAAARALARSSATLRSVEGLWVTSALLDDLVGQAPGTAPSPSPAASRRPRDAARDAPKRASARPMQAVEAVLSDLVRTGRIRRADGTAMLAGFAPRVIGGDAAVDEIVLLVEQAGLTPPSVAEIERQTGKRDVAAILRLAAAAGRLEPVERDRYFSRAALDRFVQAIQSAGPEAAVVPSELRQRLDISRKYLIPLLEWADVKGVTGWDGDVRRVRGRTRA